MLSSSQKQKCFMISQPIDSNNCCENHKIYDEYKDKFNSICSVSDTKSHESFERLESNWGIESIFLYRYRSYQAAENSIDVER